MEGDFMSQYEYWSTQQIVKSGRYSFSIGQMRHFLLHRHRNGLQNDLHQSFSKGFAKWTRQHWSIENQCY
jgi:hypothetical protein